MFSDNESYIFKMIIAQSWAEYSMTLRLIIVQVWPKCDSLAREGLRVQGMGIKKKNPVLNIE